MNRPKEQFVASPKSIADHGKVMRLDFKLAYTVMREEYDETSGLEFNELLIR